MNNIQEIWSSFKDLEYELITLSKYIYICKDNYNVYSSKIASLILYANVEIESALSIIGTTNKDMVGESIGETLNNCNRAWSLDKKTVALLNRNFHLDNDSKVITPLSYKPRSTNDFYSIYNAIKHNKLGNIKKATLHTLIRSMAALYIYNLYATMPTCSYVSDDPRTVSLPKSMQGLSSIFSPSVCNIQTVSYVTKSNSLNDEDIDKCLLINKFTDKSMEYIKAHNGIPIPTIKFGSGPEEQIEHVPPLECEVVVNLGQLKLG